MMRVLCFCLVVLILSASVAPGYAETPVDPFTEASTVESQSVPFTISAYWENDGVYVKPNNNTDKHYTNGIGISVAHQPDCADRIMSILPWYHDGDDTAMGYIAGQLMFTPRDLTTPTLITDDRPYAGYMFFGAYVQRSDETTLDHIQLDMGMVGPAAQAEELQEFIHHAFDETDPRGWDNQINDEFTVQLYVRRKWRFDLFTTELNDLGDFSGQIIPQAGLALGNVYRHLDGSVLIRVGHNLPDDFGPGRLADVADATGQSLSGLGFYLFGRLGGRIVEHNIFIDGSNFRSGPGNDSETFVGEAQLGVAVQYHCDTWRVEFNYSQTFLTEEFKGQRGKDAYGSATLAVTNEF